VSGLNRSEIAVVSFVAGFIAGVVAFVVVLPSYGLDWALELAGIVFIVSFILSLFACLGDFLEKPPSNHSP